MTTPLEKAREAARTFIAQVIDDLASEIGSESHRWTAREIHAAMVRVSDYTRSLRVHIEIAPEPGTIECSFPAPGSGRQIELEYQGATARVYAFDGKIEPVASVLVDILEGGLWIISPEVRA